MKQDIQELMSNIVELEFNRKKECNLETYMNIRALISSFFSKGIYNKEQIVLRLTIINSFYSTNAEYNYFSLKEMAEKIFSLGAKDTDVREYFNHVLETEKDEKELFSSHYGIHKNLSQGSQQMSLLSKYAYYVMMQDKRHYPLGFPIYDSIVKEIYPKICNLIGMEILISNKNELLIGEYIKAIKQLKHF